MCLSSPKAFPFPSRQAFAQITPRLRSTFSLGQATQTLSLGLANSHDPSLNLDRQSSAVDPRQGAAWAWELTSIQWSTHPCLSYCFRMQNDMKLPLNQRRK